MKGISLTLKQYKKLREIVINGSLDTHIFEMPVQSMEFERDDDGNAYFNLSRTRRCTVTKRKSVIDIREVCGILVAVLSSNHCT